MTLNVAVLTLGVLLATTAAAGDAMHDPVSPYRALLLAKSAKKTPKAASPPEAPPLPPPPPLPTNYVGVVVLPLDNSGLSNDVATDLTAAITDQIDEIPGYESVSPEDTLNAIESYHLSIGACEREVECLARLGRYARGDMVVETRVQAPAGTIMLSGRVIDTKKAVETRRVAIYLAQDEQERLQQIHELVVQLITPETFVGDLAVDCPDTGAEIYVDDQIMGYVPLPAPLQLAAGTHILRISKAGYQDINRFIDVTFHRLTTIKADLSDRTVIGALVQTHSVTGFGSFFVVSGLDGLEVRVDGEPMDSTPMVQAGRVAVGHHRLSLRGPNRQAVAQEVDIYVDQRTDLQLHVDPNGTLSLENVGTAPQTSPLPTAQSIEADRAAALALKNPPLQPPDYPTWRTYAGIGVGAAGVASLVSAFVIKRDIESYQEEAQSIQQQTQVGGLDANALTALNNRLQDVDNKGARLNTWQEVTAYGGIGLIVVAGGMAMWDMVRSLLASSPTGGAPPTPAETTMILPWCAPDTVGFSTVFQH